MDPRTPYVPTDTEARCYYYGLTSRPRLVARSSCDLWERPTGLEAYLDPKDLVPLGPHALDDLWEKTVGPAMAEYMINKGVQWNTMTPLRMGKFGDPSPPAVVLIGVNPGSLSSEVGIEVAIHCRSILVDHGILDVHVELRESKAHFDAALYAPKRTSSPIARVVGPFSTSLGIPICNANTPHYEGTAGFFFTDSAKPGKLFMLTARHVLFHPDEVANEKYEYKENSGASKVKVILLGQAAFRARVENIEKEIGYLTMESESLTTYLESVLAGKIRDENEAKKEREVVERRMKETEEAIEASNSFLADIRRDWEDEENRVIGHVVLSPPISFNVGDDGATEDWAVVEVDATKVTASNFIGNVIDLCSVDDRTLMKWMRPGFTNLHSFADFPIDGLLPLRDGVVSDQEMRRPPSAAEGQDGHPVIMVLKNGNKSGLTVGRLNTIRSLVRRYFKNELGEVSKEVAVLPRSKFSLFSEGGDSGSVVVDTKGRVCGILTGSNRATEDSDIAFVTSINFLLQRLHEFGIEANIFPMPADL